jgi:alkanesulfonate monooxygenase SsuD/methylene tetrahydromethanopterin reductase-like flavin-dependent oxidoreductase (luciferase family)
MKFELFQECQTATRDYYNRYWQMLKEVELADELGWDSYGMSEQHFTPVEYSSGCPEIFFTAVAMRTKKIRIRQGIVLLLKAVNHPLKIAERIGMMDIMSNGRMDLGTGRGNKLGMLKAFEVPLEETRQQWEEALEMIPKIWTEETFSWDGKFYHIPPTVVNPKPIQKPHPSLWTATTSPEMYELAGQKGIGVLCFDFTSPDKTAKNVEIYRKSIKTAKPVGSFVTNGVAILTMGLCAETTEYARRLAKEPMMAFISEAGRIYAELAATKVKSYQYMGKQLAEAATHPEFEYLCDNATLVVGDPEECIKKLKLYQQAGADQVIIRMDGMPHQKQMDSIRLFAEHVFPALR